jgi:dienelactone hydrolase
MAIAQTPGQLTAKVAVKADAQQTYAVYVPSTYAASRRWPVVYVYDPAARGALAAERFRTAAEQLGYIVAASNVSKNGPAEASLAALQAMSMDVESRFAIDARRRYVAGFSGGARAAVIAAMICTKCFAGVLGFGAGLPTAPKLSTTPDFAYLAGVGDSDFNYAEVTALAPTLDKLKADYRILTYEGSHEWPKADAILEALRWMNLQAIKHGTLARPSTFPDADWNARIASAKKLAISDPVQAVREYEASTRDFQSAHDTAEATAEASRLRSSAEFKKEQKDERRIADATRDNAETFDQYVHALLGAQGAGAKQAPRAAAVRLISQLRQDATSKDPYLSKVARRALSSSFVTLLQTNGELKPGDNESAIDLADLASLLYPDSPESWYWLGIAHTNAGHHRQAISAFRKALDLGTPKSRLVEDKRLTPLSSDADFKTLIAQ